MSTTATPFEQADRMMLAHRAPSGSFTAYDVPNILTTVSRGAEHWMELRVGGREEDQLVLRFWPDGRITCESN